MASDRSVTFRNGSCTLRYRRSGSASIGGESTGFSSQGLPARSCDKCQIRSNLFARSRSENHSKSKCTDCGLLQKQKAMRKWRTLYMTFVVASITRTTSEEELMNQIIALLTTNPDLVHKGIILSMSSMFLGLLSYQTQFKFMKFKMMKFAVTKSFQKQQSKLQEVISSCSAGSSTCLVRFA